MPNIPGIKPEVVNEMRRANRDGETYSSLEKRFPYSRPTITAACQGRHPYDGSFDEPPVLPRACGVCRTREEVLSGPLARALSGLRLPQMLRRARRSAPNGGDDMTRSPYDHPLARLANQLVAATDALAELEKQQTYVSTLNRNEENCHEFLNPDEDSTEIVNPAWVEASGTYPNVYSWEHPIVQEHTALWRMRRHARKRLGLAFLPKHCRGCKRSIYFPVDGLCEFCQRYGPPLPPDEERAARRAELPMETFGWSGGGNTVKTARPASSCTRTSARPAARPRRPTRRSSPSCR